MKPKAIVLTGAGLNCERESAYALEVVGFEAQIIHIIDFIENPSVLNHAQLLMFVGGFSYGDYAGGGFVLAEQIRQISDEIAKFIEQDRRILGVCNGCQLLLRLGLFEGLDWRFRTNAQERYECRWIHVEAKADTAFHKKNARYYIPIGHGEGRLFGGKAENIALSYVDEKGAAANGVYPINPNGAEQDAAGIFAHQGKVLAMMPHPERGAFEWQRPDFLQRKTLAQRANTPFDAEGLSDGGEIFQNLFQSLQ